MTHEANRPVVELNAEQLTASMTEAVRTALSGCEITPTQLEDGSQERFVSVSPEDIDTSYIQLREVIGADGSTKTYEYGFNSYHDNVHTQGYRWKEGDDTVKRVRGDIKDSRKPQARVELEEAGVDVDPTTFSYIGGLEDGNQYFDYVKTYIGRVPELRKRQLQLEAWHAEDQSPQKGALARLLSKVVRR